MPDDEKRIAHAYSEGFGYEGELAHLSKPAMLIYFLMFFLGCVYWIAFLWFATDEANFY